MKSYDHVLETVEDAWFDWYGEEGVRVFSRFLLNVVLYLLEHRFDREHMFEWQFQYLQQGCDY